MAHKDKAKKPLKPSAMRVLALLKKSWTTPMDALRKAGVMSFNARISEIRKAGYKVQSEKVVIRTGIYVNRHRIKSV